MLSFPSFVEPAVGLWRQCLALLSLTAANGPLYSLGGTIQHRFCYRYCDVVPWSTLSAIPRPVHTSAPQELPEAGSRD